MVTEIPLEIFLGVIIVWCVFGVWFLRQEIKRGCAWIKD